MGCTYVKEFDFGSKGKDGTVKYAKGGAVKAPGFVGQTMIKDTSKLGIKDNKNPGIKGSKPVAPDLPTLKLAKGGQAKMPRMEAMDKREMAMTPTMRREAAMTSRKVEAPARKMVPVAPREPMLAMKSGGKVTSKACGGSVKAYKR